MFSQKWDSCVFVGPKCIFISSCHSLLSWIITHNFLLSLSESVKSLGFIYLIQYHTFITGLSATILYKYVCLSAFNMFMLPLCALLHLPITTQSSRSHQLLHFISLHQPPRPVWGECGWGCISLQLRAEPPWSQNLSHTLNNRHPDWLLLSFIPKLKE